MLDAVTTLSDWSMDFSEGKSTKAAAAAAAVQAQMLSMVAQGGAPTEAATEDVDPGATAADGGAAAASGVGGVGGVVDRSGASGRVKGGPVTTLSPAKQLGLPGAIAPPPRPRCCIPSLGQLRKRSMLKFYLIKILFRCVASDQTPTTL